MGKLPKVDKQKVDRESVILFSNCAFLLFCLSLLFLAITITNL